MEVSWLQQLAEAETAAERDAVMLAMSLSSLSPDLRNALEAAAVPHWFNAAFLDALLAEDSDPIYDDLLALSFVELVPGQGYAIHELTRKQLIRELWQQKQEHFLKLSERAADYCAEQDAADSNEGWQAEEIYHRLVSDPDAGVDSLRALATKWANYEYHTYEEVEYIVRLAGEQIDAGRMSGAGEAWTMLWQARLALIFGRPDLALDILDQIMLEPEGDPVLAAEVAQTRGDMLAQLGDEAGMEEAWREAYSRYDQMADGGGQLDAFLVAEKMHAVGLADPQPAARREEEPVPPGADALRLIDNIKYAWIDGVLRTAVDESIKLRMARDGRVASHIVLHHPQGIDRLVGAGRLSRLFCAAGQSMLILGAPGSGKTITLLQLLEELLDEARIDDDAPIPLLFNLSSFGKYAQEEGTDLTGWVADQAYKQYRLKRETTREQLAAGTEITLLLDGLDEVPLAELETCVEAINDFVQAYPCGLVVCSRIGDYQALNRELVLAHALVLQPLSDGQIFAVLEGQEEPARSAMLAQIRSDWQLREALRSPLLISLYPQAFSELHTSEWSSTNTVEARRQSLFSAYVDTVFEKPTATESSEATETFKTQSQGWLAFLSGKMQEARTTIFYVEDLQPDWLPERLIGRYRGLYALFLGFFLGLLVGLISGIAAKPSFALRFGLSGGLGSLVAVTMAVWLTSAIQNHWPQAVIGSITAWLIIALSYGLAYWQTVDPGSGLRIGLYFGLIFGINDGLGTIISSGIAAMGLEVKLREQIRVLRPSKRQITANARRGGVYGLVIGLIVALISYISDVLVFGVGSYGLSVGVAAGFIWGLIGGLIGGLVGGLLGALSSFLDTPHVDERPFPGQGVRLSLRYAWSLALFTGLFFSLPTWFIGQLIGARGMLLGLVLGTTMPLTFTWFGGLAWSQHMALRILLSRNECLPPIHQLIPWLDRMTALGLLRRVGGGYIFIHRSLLEYFAALETP